LASGVEHVVREAPRLMGRFRPPGDKSISHRSLFLASLADGESIVTGLNPGADVNTSRSVLERLGITIQGTAEQATIRGAGGSFIPPDSDLDCGNSGTTMRLLTGMLAGRPGTFRLTGDASLSRRPMARVAVPLRGMGASVELAAGDRPPVIVRGRKLAPPAMPEMVRSAQVKSALILAGLTARGRTTLVESVDSRDHTERLLTLFGIQVARQGRTITIEGPGALGAARVSVPGDPSAAAFFLAAAAMLPGSEVTATGITVNPTRRAAIDILARMGAGVTIVPADGTAGADTGEPVADVTVRAGTLTATTIEGTEAALAVDELPILAVTACRAEGTTIIRDAAELRVKESDRIHGLAQGLIALGADVTERPDGLTIRGTGSDFAFTGGTVDSLGDHRLAMAFRIAGLLASGRVDVLGAESAAISDPAFEKTLAELTA
jgi:3-phosphoshikimate 1-carboxyvinyltransferase